MALKNLTHFTEFDASRFLSRKELRFVSAKRWIEKSETGSEIEKGVKVGVLISKRKNKYWRATHCKSSTSIDEGL